MKLNLKIALPPILFLVGAICFYDPAYAADSNLVNIRPDQQPGYINPPDGAQNYAPGRIVILPDGRRATITELLPDGRFRTDLNAIIDQHGYIVEGADQGKLVILAPEQEQTVTITTLPGQNQAPASPEAMAMPEQKLIVPEAATAPDKNQAPEETVALPTTPISPEQQTIPEQQPERQVAIPAIPARPEQKPVQPNPVAPEQPAGPITIVELLPMTKVPAQKPEETKQAPEPAPAKAAQEPKKPEQPDHAKARPEKPNKAEQPQKAKPEEPKKPKPGQELRIPPEAAKKGDLSFLEGCWQGTRPEYYSKRTIKECFCFGANGQNGKRRVFDPIGKRQCVGSSKARLSASGVLSVTSSGAACSDGERWGQADMVCKNSGPKTPCSWVFRDANNASQSYQIPFVRVESCGR